MKFQIFSNCVKIFLDTINYFHNFDCCILVIFHPNYVLERRFKHLNCNITRVYKTKVQHRGDEVLPINEFSCFEVI